MQLTRYTTKEMLSFRKASLNICYMLATYLALSSDIHNLSYPQTLLNSGIRKF